MDIITSKDNAQVKEARKLLLKKNRDKSGSYLIEGFHLLEEAQKYGAEIKRVFATEKAYKNLDDSFSDITLLSEDVLKTISDVESPEGVIAVVKKPEEFDFNLHKLLILENIQDPGNVGTMVRTADAAGFDAVFTSKGTADIYSPKVMRSMQGSNFHLAIVNDLEIDKIFSELKAQHVKIFVSTLSDQSVDYQTLSASEQQFALVMGNEGAGVSEFASDNADKLVHITMPGQAESLNVAVAAGILMFAL